MRTSPGYLFDVFYLDYLSKCLFFQIHNWVVKKDFDSLSSRANRRTYDDPIKYLIAVSHDVWKRATRRFILRKTSARGLR